MELQNVNLKSTWTPDTAYENWTEKEVLAALDAYFEAIVDAVRGQGGDVLKFMGDGVLSAFVIDDDNPKTQQAERSLLAAQDAHIALKEVNIARSRNNLPELTIGCGIDVGEVTYGNIGSPERLDFTVLGRAVNTASRVQELCKSLKDPTLVTSNIAELCPERCRSLGPFKIRGLSQPVEIFAVDDGD